MGYSIIYIGAGTQVYSLYISGGHPRVKLWFDGNSQGTYRIDTAYIVQGDETIIICSDFDVPRNGRWSDWIDVSSLTLPATVDLYIAVSNPVIMPDSPVGGVVPVTDPPTITPSDSPITSDPTYESTPPVGYSHKGWYSFASSDDGTTLIACATAQVIYDDEGGVIACSGTGKVFISRDSGVTWTDITPPDWFGHLPKVCCDTTGEKIALTSQPLQGPTINASTMTKSEFSDILVAKHDGCIMTSADGGSNWTARWPGYGANPGIWASSTSLTVSVSSQPEFTIASGLNMSFYGSVAKMEYKVHAYGFDGSGALGVDADGTFVSYISSAFKMTVTGTSGGGGPYSYGDWLIFFTARYGYTSIDMSSDGQTIVAGMKDGSAENGAFISRDGGATWSKLNFRLGVDYDYSNITCYPYGAVSDDGQKIVFSTGTMLFYSTDGGTTVNFTSEEANAYKTQICGDGTTAFNISDTYALYQSTDGLANWVAVNAPATPSYVLDYSVSEDGNTICEFYLDVAAVSWNVGVSIDSGTTWTTLLSRPIDAIESPAIFTMFSVAISPDGDTVVVGESKPDATYDNVFIFKAPYTSPTEIIIDPIIEMTTTVIINTGTITVSNNSLVLEDETITIDGVVYTFKTIPSGVENEIIIGVSAAATAESIASVLSAVTGDLISATADGAVASVSFLSPDVITWSTTSSGITLDPVGTMTQTTTYTAASAPASLPCLTVSGSIATPMTIPLLSVAAEASFLPFGAGTLPLLRVSTSMSHQSITCNASSDDAVKISLLEVGNDLLESLAAGLFDHADDDSFALEVTQWVTDNITYLADSVDTWNNATKTLFAGYGDCEDGAILLASLLINGGVDAAKVRVYIGAYTVNEVSTGHAWVEYFRDSDHQWVTLDWTMGSVYWYGIYQLSTLSKTYPDMTQTYTTATEYITSTNAVALADTDAYVVSLQITSMAGTFPLMTVTAADQNRGAMAGTLRALTAHGVTGNFGNLSKSIPVLTSSGFVGSVTADLSSALPIFTISAMGINANRVTLSSFFPAISMAGEAYQLNYGIVSALLPKPVCAASGYPVIKMIAALELPMLKMAGAGRTARDFDDFVIKHEYDTWAYAHADLPLPTISGGAS